ncbi:serine/arginine repetitive matrix protein 1-like [Ischnura elegans]|uniref:serine/arginine repetitive matrix protein 1-like n=1 Tax=Ischnura elegans TaxID=197161 RepID=UPI001ED8B65D|nr:serine/arginine repetitive matrix protein 1-like [Ischnura elegans]
MSQKDDHPPSPTFSTIGQEDNLPLLQEAIVWLKEQECSLEEPCVKSDSDIPLMSQKDDYPPSPTFSTIGQEDNLPLIQEVRFCAVWAVGGISPESHKEYHPPSPHTINVKKDNLRPLHEKLLKECKEVDSSLSDLPQENPPIVLQDDQLPPPRKREAKGRGRRPTKKWNLGLPPLTLARAPPPPPPTPVKPLDGNLTSHSGAQEHSPEGRKQMRRREPSYTEKIPPIPPPTPTVTLDDSLPSQRMLECSMEERMLSRKSDSIPAAYHEQSPSPLLKPSPSLREVQRKWEHSVEKKKSTRRSDPSLPPLSHSGPLRPSPPTAAKYLASSASRGTRVHKGRNLIVKSESDIVGLSDEHCHRPSPTLPSELQFCRSPALVKHRERRLEERKLVRKSGPCKTPSFPCPLPKPRTTIRDTQHKGSKTPSLSQWKESPVHLAGPVIQYSLGRCQSP